MIENIVCPECGKEQSRDTKVCLECGFPLKENTKNCIECGMELKSDSMICSNCGYDNGRIENKEVSTNRSKLIASVSIVLACFLFVLAFTRINNDQYEFYKVHYEECMIGYEESMYMAETSSWLFSNSYENIADSYKDMADDDMRELNKYRVQAVVCVIVGMSVLFVGNKMKK